FLLEPEQVDGLLARVEAAPGVGDHLDEFRDRRNVELLHLGSQVMGHHRRHAGHATEQRCQMQSGIADGRDLDVLVARLVDGVEAEEGEEEIGVDTFSACAVRHDESGVDTVQRTLRDDDRHLVDGCGHIGGGLSSWFQSCCGHRRVSLQDSDVRIQMHPRGLGMPATRAATFAGPFGKSWYSSLMLTPEVLPSTRTVGPVPFAKYSLRMKLMTCQCRSVSWSMPSRAASAGTMSSLQSSGCRKKPSSLRARSMTGSDTTDIACLL